MIKQFTDYLLSTASRHKAVNTVAYKRDVNINHQHNTPYYQFIMDDENLITKLLTQGLITYRTNVTVLGFVTSDDTVINVQETALHIALDWMEYIATDPNGFGLLIHDYSILSFSEYTDDNCAGVRLTITFTIPSPINLCEFQSNFIDKDITTDEDDTLTLAYKDDECTNTTFTPHNNNTNLNLNPIRLK